MKILFSISLSVFAVFLSITTMFAQTAYWAPVTSPSSGGIYALLFDSHGHLFAGTDVDGLLFRSTDDGATWTMADTGLTLYTSVRALAEVNGGLLAGTPDGIFRSTDDGSNWTPAGLTSRSVNSLKVHTNGAVYAGTGNGAVYKSIDNGINWSLVDSTGPAMNFKALTVTRSGYILSGISVDFFFSTGGIRRSTNNGISWAPANNGLFSDDIRSFVASPNGDIFVGIDSGGVYRSTDEGNTWNATAMTIHSVYALAADDSGHLFAGTFDDGVYRSSDDGDSWEQINDGLSTTAIHSLAINNTHHVFAGTEGLGIFRGIEQTTPVEEPAHILPASFKAHQNYPNPFNPSTVIRYDLPSRQYVNLKIYNILGHEIATVVDGLQDAGTKAVEWNGSNLPSGMYFYRLQTGNNVVTKKMVLMK